jgi:hypothetical protein
MRCAAVPWASEPGTTYLVPIATKDDLADVQKRDLLPKNVETGSSMFSSAIWIVYRTVRLDRHGRKLRLHSIDRGLQHLFDARNR